MMVHMERFYLHKIKKQLDYPPKEIVTKAVSCISGSFSPFSDDNSR